MCMWSAVVDEAGNIVVSWTFLSAGYPSANQSDPSETRESSQSHNTLSDIDITFSGHNNGWLTR